MVKTLAEFYIGLLKEYRGQPPTNFDDTSRGCLLALIKDRPTIWNSTAKLNKDDVLASFHQCSVIMVNMHPCFNIWAVIEKWCWIVEIYVRCTLTTPPTEWRYNNTLEYLKPFAMGNYPYLGCISKKRRNELTKLYNDPVITEVEEATKDLEFTAGIFREELYCLSGEEKLIQVDIDNIALAKTVGQIVHAKRRGRPSKADKKSPAEHFINLTPQSAQFQKLLENNGVSAFSAVSFLEAEEYDDLGFSPTMYMALIEIIQEKPGVWQQGHPQRGDSEYREKVFDETAKALILKFKDAADLFQITKLNSASVRKAWERLRDSYKQEENLETTSKSRYFQHLQFLSTRLMPAFLTENGFVKTEEPSTSAGFPVIETSPAESSQSEDSRMAASSPATVSATQFAAVSNGNKSIQAVLENLVAARTKKEESGLNGGFDQLFQPQDFSEIRQLLQPKLTKLEAENGAPPVKRVKQEGGSPPGSSRMIVYNNDVRQAAQAPISTWVPPREDLTAKMKEDVLPTPPQKRAQATALVKPGVPLNNSSFKKIFQNPTLVPATIAGSLPQRAANMLINGIPITTSALQQQLLLRQQPQSSISSAASPSVSVSQLQQQQQPQQSTQHQQPQAQTNGNAPVILTPAPDPEDKWALLGRMIAATAREIESRSPVEAANFFKALNDCIHEYNIKTLATDNSKPPVLSPESQDSIVPDETEDTKSNDSQ